MKSKSTELVLEVVSENGDNFRLASFKRRKVYERQRGEYVRSLGAFHETCGRTKDGIPVVHHDRKGFAPKPFESVRLSAADEISANGNLTSYGGY